MGAIKKTSKASNKGKTTQGRGRAAKPAAVTGRGKASGGQARSSTVKKASPKKASPKRASVAVRSEVLVPPSSIDVAQFEASYERVASRAQTISKEAIVSSNVDLQLAALVALKVAQDAGEAKLRQRFASLARSGEYSDACVDALPEVAMAAWYAHYRALHAGAASAGPPPTELSSRGYKLRSHMLRVLEYNLDEDQGVMKQVTLIRAGTGYLDLANDLTALSELYVKHASALEVDQRRYQASDAVAAKQLASALLTYLGGGTKAPAGGWEEAEGRFWTLLDQTYREVRRGGLFLLPGEEGERRFPALVAAARALRPSSAGPGKSSSPTPPSPPADDANED